MSWWAWILVVGGGFVVVVVVYDLLQTGHAILRNFPVIGHLRYTLERFGPELRQYIVSDNDEERPFSRDQRRLVYASAKRENSYFGFGTDNRVDADGYICFRHSAFPVPPDGDNEGPLPAAKVLGARQDRPGAFRPRSIIGISAMSFGSLSGRAIEALNRGAAIAGCLHNTGEGGISDYHRRGGDLVFQIGTGYFGARDANGEFSMDVLLESVASAPVRAIEVKLSQGAKPGLGGVLPAAKVTREIARTRGVPVGVTVRSPTRHATFDDVTGLIDFVERIADETGLPVGIKSAVGETEFWHELSGRIAVDGRGPDYVAVDGGEGGTGAAPLVFADHVALPFRAAFPTVYRAFAEAGVADDVVFVGAGKLGFATDATVAIAMGVDIVNVGRESMLAIGCIQAQRCHTGHCPTGVATQSRWLMRGLDPTSKAARFANYAAALQYDLRGLAHALGAPHPALIDPARIEIRRGTDGFVPLLESVGLDASWFGSARRSRLEATLRG